MPLAPIFDDLFAFAEGSITWLRVFHGPGDGAVALSIEPTDNPFISTINAAEDLVERVAAAFPGVGPLRLFLAFAGCKSGIESRWHEVKCEGGSTDFELCSTQDVESLVGAGNAIPENIGETCVELGGRQHPLLALIPEPEPGVDPLDQMAVVAVVDLPWPHNPSNCELSCRFGQIESLYGVSGHDSPAVGAGWHLSLSPSDFDRCPYHQGDWLKVAEVAVHLVEDRGPVEARDQLLERGYQLLESEQDRHWLLSLFSQPISWAPVLPRVTNGQHRSCALRASGAPFCIVDTHGRTVPFSEPGDPTRRAAADLAAYWARRASK